MPVAILSCFGLLLAFPLRGYFLPSVGGYLLPILHTCTMLAGIPLGSFQPAVAGVLDILGAVFLPLRGTVTLSPSCVSVPVGSRLVVPVRPVLHFFGCCLRLMTLLFGVAFYTTCSTNCVFLPSADFFAQQ